MENSQTVNEQQRKIGRLPIIAILITVILLFAFFLKDILIPFIDMEVQNNVDGATELLKEKGLFGFLTVILVEALQMVVIFIPAEFIQISSGLSYPFPAALLLCDIGVCLGATIIFILVRVFHVQSDAYEKRKTKIDKFSAGVRDRNTVFLMYLLFFMPLVPFGAICYYGSSTKLKYRRYILTVATGVIPSIVVSNLMGAAGKAFIEHSLSLWLLLLIIASLALLLFAIIWFFIKRIYLKGTEGTPDSPVYSLLFTIISIWYGSTKNIHVDDEKLSKASCPYIMLSNHESFFDFYYISKMAHPRTPNFLINEYYCTRPILRWMAKQAGFVPKKLFVHEMRPALGIRRTIKSGYPMVIFPEGRLSPDGKTNPIIPGGAFYKKLGVDIVLTKISGGYFSNPKWRKRRFKTEINATVVKVIKKEELQSLDADALDDLIGKTLFNDASHCNTGKYPQLDKAIGLQNILYRCIDCNSLYTTVGRGNSLVCTKCGSKHTLNQYYRFPKEPKTIGDYYDRIKELERTSLDSFELKTKVHTKIHIGDTGRSRKEDGECTLNPSSFSYKSQSMEFSVKLEDMDALAFSCDEEFEIYNGDDLLYFYPVENRQQVARWALLVDLIAQRRRTYEEKNTD